MTSTKRQLISGVAYTAAAKYAGVVVSLVVAGILARLLPPADFGIVAIATVIIAFFSIFSDLGVAPAIIQKQDLTERDLSNIFSFTLFTGVGMGLLFFALARPIADFYESEPLFNICRLLSINLVFATFNIVPNALLYKSKMFRFIAVRTVVVQATCGAVAVSAALLGVGIYALLINPICSSVIIFIISYIKFPQRLTLHPKIESIRKIFGFSMYQFMFNLMNYFTRNADKLLVGRYMGMVDLGYYEKSYRLMMLPLQNITHIVSPVMHPIFADFQHDFQKLSESYLKVIRFLSFVGFPLSVLLFFTARELTLMVFGAQWEPSVAVFKILALSVGIQIILSTSGSIFQAANSTKMMFFSGLFSSVLNVAGILVGIFVFRSLEAVAWGICATFAFNFVQCYVLMYRVTFRLPIVQFWRQLLSPLVVSALIALFLSVITPFLVELTLFVCFVVKILIFFTTLSLYVQLTGEFDIPGKIRSVLKLK